MNTKNVFIAAGSVALAVGSIFAVKAATKKTLLNNLYFQDGVNNCKQITDLQAFTSTTLSGISFITTGGASVQVYTTFSGTTCQHPVSVRLKL